MSKNKGNNRKVFIIILAVVTLIVIGYIGQGLYFRYTGAIRTEYIFEAANDETISLDGFVIRDEMRMKDGVNTAIILSPKNGVYSPVISDGGSVAKNDDIAYIFDTKEQAENYEKKVEVKEKIETLKLLQNNKNLNYLDVSTLNNEIVSAIGDYMDVIDSNNLLECDKLIENINYKITSKQIITGKKIDFSKEINSLKKQQEDYEKFSSKKGSVKAKYAGYFVSGTDGYEQAFDYYKLEKNGITAKQIDKLMSSEPKTIKNSLGKIVGQHAWYFVCKMSVSQGSNLKTNETVKVTFPDKGLSDINMTVKKIQRDEDFMAVVFKCVLMNGDLLGLRKETANITINSYYGFKISHDAVVSENGVVGIYTHDGNLAVFKPINLLYSTEDYVIADSVRDKDGEVKDPAKALKQFDKVIVKGRNLYDNKFIG